MQNLEEKLKEIFLENQKLKSENNSLKEKINSLTIEASFHIFLILKSKDFFTYNQNVILKIFSLF